jgi:hypothetical protein
MQSGDVRAQRRMTAAVPVDEVIDVIKDEEEAQLAVTWRTGVPCADDAAR